MVLAAALAIPFRVNLPLSIALVWITNPLTMPPIFYCSYIVGVFALGQERQPFHFEASWEWLAQSLSTIGPAFITGSLICASIAAVIGFFGIDLLWRRSVNKAWQGRGKS